MRKVTLEDVSAITHAERYFHQAIVPNMSPRHRQELEDDLERLTYVKKVILQRLYEPGLPSKSETPEEKPANGNSSRTSDSG